MQTQRVNRSDAEKIFMVIKNVDADSITTGWATRIVGAAAAEIVSSDGVNAVKPTALNSQFAGIAAEDIVSNGFGRVQVWGYVNSIAYSFEANKTVGVTGNASSFLKVGGAVGTFTSTQVPEALSTAQSKFVQAFTTVNISGGIPYGSGFVRAL